LVARLLLRLAGRSSTPAAARASSGLPDGRAWQARLRLVGQVPLRQIKSRPDQESDADKLTSLLKGSGKHTRYRISLDEVGRYVDFLSMKSAVMSTATEPARKTVAPAIALASVGNEAWTRRA
jgi:hypothetical protein